jgi:hypothetical protein
MFKIVLPRVQTEFTKVMRIYDNFQGKVDLFIVYLCNHMFGSLF